MSTNQESEFSRYVEGRLSSVLQRLAAVHGGARPSVQPVGERPGPEPTKQVQDMPELEGDLVNDTASRASLAHICSVAPDPPSAPDGVDSVEVAVVSDVPVVRAREAEGFDLTLPVQSTLAGIDGAKVHFANVVKQAHQAVRSEGDLASSIAITIGQDATESTEATVTAFTSRVAGARIALQKGALPSRLPSQGMDVRLTTIRDVMRDQRQWPQHTPVFIPASLSDEEGAALVSLLVNGGPGAYSWRYPGGVVDPGVMPAVTRWRWPGGTDRLLVVSESDRDWNVFFGGRALTHAALVGLENYYRGMWGDAIFDEGWRAAFALSGVYCEPRDIKLRVGRDFQAKQVCRAYTVDGESVDVDVPWEGPSPAPDDEDNEALRGLHTSMPPSLSSMCGLPLWRAWVAVHGGDHPADNRPDPDGFASYRFENVGVVFTDTRGNQWSVAWEHLTSPEMAEAHPDLARVATRARYIQLRLAFGTGVGAGDEAPPYDPRTFQVRNVFGQTDRAMLLIPRLRVASILALLAGISVTVPAEPVQRYMDDNSMRLVAMAFASRLHFSFIRSLSEQRLEPAVVRAMPLAGAVGMLGVPSALRTAVLPKLLSADGYHTGGLECLENGGIFTTHNWTPYAGFDVPGTWDATGGIISVSTTSNDYAALDSAARATWNGNGRIDIHTRLGPRTVVGVIFSIERMANPFALPRFVTGTRGVEALRVQAGAGLNALLAGKPMGSFLWSTY
ncbi:hypothetical protein 2 [Cordyceps chanhua alternavirus 1]|uniref:Uncharacterized protein n=1 Tax=Cordyceps chanhua alternavirus 1 TaxID=2936613 RepID=A0A8U0LTH3_9VIRU|nr:hypothetical protein 2 [Cordyceps chanhua alternavirus 1]UPH33986.1 hypothetical protein 2 [Cordyceps chanhua alternavirus 1]